MRDFINRFSKGVYFTALIGGLVLLPATSSGGVEATSDEVLAGVIRWDAWVGAGMHFGKTNQESLSPSQWHSRIPFYSHVTAENKVEIVATEQAVMDQEILYARAGGLDYFAFLMYDNFHPNGGGYALSRSLALYETSAFKDRLNFAVIMPNPSHIKVEDWDRWVARFVGYFSQPTYQLVLGGRPLVYAFRWYPWELAANMIESIEVACAAAGLPEPYFVDLYFNNSLHSSFDALSNYAISDYANPTGTFPFSKLAGIAEADSKRRISAGLKVVPHATSGWNARPRLEYPGDWDAATHPWYNDEYELPTPAELAAHVEATVQLVQANPVACEAKTILIYAWNEFGEGGWLCPGLPEYEGAARLRALAPVLHGGLAGSQTEAGTPKAWLDQFFVTDNHEYFDLRDIDGDGQPTFAEYYAGTDPTDAGSFFWAWPEAKGPGPGFSIRFAGIRGRTYTVWYSENLVEWSSLPSVVPEADGVIEVVDETSMTWRFYRVSVRL